MSIRVREFKQALMGLAVLAIILYAAAPSATADVIFSNFITPGIPASGFDTNPADAYFVNQSSFCSTGGPVSSCAVDNIDIPEVIGVQFTLANELAFDQAQLPLFLISGTNQIDIYLEQDSGGVPGSILSTFGVDNALGLSASVIEVGAGLPGVSLLAGAANPDLAANAPYWLVADVPAADTIAAWNANLTNDLSGGATPSDPCPGATSSSSDFVVNSVPSPTGPWTPVACTRPAFEIDGTPAQSSTVPEPSSIVLLGMGLAGLLLLWKRERSLARSED